MGLGDRYGMLFSMKKTLIFLVAVAALVAIALYFYDRVRTQTPTEGMKTYHSEKYGLTFEYPERYYLEEREEGNGEREHHVIILTDDTEENRAVREGEAPGREGPIAITVDVYQNDLDMLTAEEWMKNNSRSNFKLSDGAYDTPVINNLSGVSYRWDGLYLGRTLAFANNKYVYAFTATYMNPNDFTLVDLAKIIVSTVIQ